MPQRAGRRSSRAQGSRGVRLTDARPWDRRLLMRPRPDQIGMGCAVDGVVHGGGQTPCVFTFYRRGVRRGGG